MGKRAGKTLLQRHKGNQQACDTIKKKKLNKCLNKNHIKIASHNSENGLHEKNGGASVYIVLYWRNSVCLAHS